MSYTGDDDVDLFHDVMDGNPNDAPDDVDDEELITPSSVMEGGGFMDRVREDPGFKTPSPPSPSLDAFNNRRDTRSLDDDGYRDDEIVPRARFETARSSLNGSFRDAVEISDQEDDANISVHHHHHQQKQSMQQQQNQQQQHPNINNMKENRERYGKEKLMTTSQQSQSDPTAINDDNFNINNNNKDTTSLDGVVAGGDGGVLKMSRPRRETENFDTENYSTNDFYDVVELSNEEHEKAQEKMRNQQQSKQQQQQHQHLRGMNGSYLPLSSHNLGLGHAVTSTSSQRLSRRHFHEISPSRGKRKNYGALNDSDMDSYYVGSSDDGSQSSDNGVKKRAGNNTGNGFSRHYGQSQNSRSSRHDPDSPDLQIQGSVGVNSSFDLNNQTDDERSALLTISSGEIALVGRPSTQEPPPIVYGRRWYILLLFCMASLLQGMGWATFGPLAQSCKAVLGWSNSDIALQGIVGNLAYCFGCVPFSWAVEKKGLRTSMVLAMFFLTAGFGMRCITLYPPWASWSVTIGTIFLGFGAIVPYSGVSLLSSKWFPTYQRTTATTIATLTGYFGNAIGAVVGPQVVPDPPSTPKHPGLHNLHWNPADHATDDQMVGHQYNSSIVRQERTAMSHLFYTEAGICAFIFLLILIYFPAHPPTPPSKTAKEERLELKEGLKGLCGNRTFLLVLLANCCGPGTYGNFSIVLDMDVKPLGVSQKTAGWFGFYGIMGACLAGLVLSRLLDRFPLQMKRSVIILMTASTFIFVWFFLLEGKFIPFDWASLYITTIVPGVINYSVMPLFFELACEASYPTGEGITTLSLTFCCNIISSIFLAIFFVPNIGVMWMNYVLLVAMVASIAILILTKIPYNRYNLDAMEIQVPSPSALHPNLEQPPLPPKILLSSSLSSSSFSSLSAA